MDKSLKNKNAWGKFFEQMKKEENIEITVDSKKHMRHIEKSYEKTNQAYLHARHMVVK